MIRLLLFVVIITAMGSLKQKDEYVCKNRIKQTFYLNNKKVFTSIRFESNMSFGSSWGITDHPSNKKFDADSVTYELIWEN